MLGLYVHVPFCSAICNYCNFNRGLFDADLKNQYVAALLEEIRRKGDGDAADTIFFGGGTPSLLDPAEIARRADELSDIAEEVMAQRAADRVGETVEVLIEEDLGGQLYQGRAAHQAPEVDGATTVASPVPLAAGDMVSATVTGSEGVDLTADARPVPRRPGQTR